MFFTKPFTQAEIDAAIIQHEKQHYPTRFNFLKEIRGIRPATMMGLLGTPGSGKSTLTKSIVADTAEYTKVLIYLTEEDPRDYQILLNVLNTKLENVVFLHEKNLFFQGMTLEQQKMYFEEAVVASGANVIFFDNVTTSALYESLNVRGQGDMVHFFRSLCERKQLTMFYVAHTKKDVTDNQGSLIEGEDVRGSNQLFQQSQYFFILQNISVNNDMFPMLRIRKHRFHEVKKKFFLLGFESSAYRFDRAIDFEYIADIFKQRNQLKR
jgi:ABC-type thiamine transport system ATPase subunit